MGIRFWAGLWTLAIAWQFACLGSRADVLKFEPNLSSHDPVFHSKEAGCSSPSPHVVMVYLPKDRAQLGFLHFGPIAGKTIVCPVMARGKTDYTAGRKIVNSFTSWSISMGATPPVIYQAHPNATMKSFVKGRWGTKVPLDMHIMSVPENKREVLGRDDFAIHARPDVFYENGEKYYNFSQVNTAGCLKPSDQCLGMVNKFYAEHVQTRLENKKIYEGIRTKAEGLYRRLNVLERAQLKFLSPPEGHRDFPGNAPNMDDKKIDDPGNIIFIVSEHDKVNMKNMTVTNGAKDFDLCSLGEL